MEASSVLDCSTMTFASVCSGIEAPSVAWQGWEPLWFSEIEPFCCALLKTHYPEVINYGDFTKIQDARVPDVLMGGTPCQSLSVAGKRAGLDDPRGNLTLEYLRLAKRLGVRWIVWENVQGALSHDRGRTFEAILGALAQCGYGFAYRVLDAQYDGLAQRRKRVFVVGYLGDWRPPAAVLFERESLRRDTTPSRKKGEEVAGTIGGGSGTRGWADDTDRAGAFIPILEANARQGTKGDPRDGIGIGDPGDPMFTLSGKQHAVAATYVNCDARTKVDSIARPLKSDTGSGGRGCVLAATLNGRGSGGSHSSANNIQPAAAAVRRLTPLEWERLQGFPDGYTVITYRGKPAADGPRYKAIGNSISIPTLRWIGQRIEKVDAILRTLVIP